MINIDIRKNTFDPEPSAVVIVMLLKHTNFNTCQQTNYFISKVRTVEWTKQNSCNWILKVPVRRTLEYI